VEVVRQALFDLSPLGNADAFPAPALGIANPDV